MFGFGFPLVGLGGMVRRMRRACGVGVATVVVAAVVVSGCSGGAGGEAKGSPSPVVSETLEAPVPQPTFPNTPEGEIDQAAAESGWEVDSSYGLASEFVADMCAWLPTIGAGEVSRPQRLAESDNMLGDGPAVLEAGIPVLCPEWSAVLAQAVSGDYERWYGSGTFVVRSKSGSADPESGEQLIAPGTYRTVGDLEDCYWERTSRSGEILDNRFATSAQEIVVTIRGSDGQFTSRGCGTWKPAK